MKCLKCNTENAGDSSFCKKCGQALPELESSDEVTMVSDHVHIDQFIANNRFRVLKRLGQGGMGEVLLAEDVKLKRKVAIKSIIKSSSNEKSARLRFLREAQTASQLDHPNICTIYEIYEDESQDKSFIIMQFVDGVTLGQIIAMKRLNTDRILDISIQTCSGMIEAHAKDVIHRDIKPGNIMVDYKGVVKILDFGLAKFRDSDIFKDNGEVDSNLTEKGFVLGTVAYISPEQARGKSLDQRSDIFSFGLVLFEMLEGRNPFKAEDQIETLYNVLNKEVEFTHDIPDELKRIVRKTLQKDREDRYTDFQSLKKDLESFKNRLAKTQDHKEEPGATEIINVKEQAEMLGQIQKTSDIENLAQMVYRIKKYKASTERVLSTKRKKWRLLWIIPLLILISTASYFWLTSKQPTQPVKQDKLFYVYLHPFENNTQDKKLKAFPEMLDFLLMESLNQFPLFKVINKEAALPIAATGPDLDQVDLGLLKKRFNIHYVLSGKISNQGDVFTIDADLKPIETGQPSISITASGSGLDSILKTQIDLVTRRVHSGIFPEKDKNTLVKKTSRLFGSNWDKFTQFFEALQYYKKVKYGMAEIFFLKAPDMLISKFYLAHLYYFDGDRKKALEMINEIFPSIDKLPRSMQLKIKAIKARLNFQFKAEIVCLEELKNEFPFSKEAFFELGEAHFHHANPDEAIKYYLNALELDSKYSPALNHLGYCYSYIGDHENSIRAFENYRNLDDSPNSFDSLGDGYFYSGYLDDSLAMKKSAAAPDKDKQVISYPYQTIADIFILKALYLNAQDALKKYTQIEDEEKDAIAYADAKNAFIFYERQKFNDALTAIDNSLKNHDSKDIKDNTAERHWLKGLILLAQNKLDECKKELAWLDEFKNNYKLDQDNFNAGLKFYIHLDALIAEHEGRFSSADNLFKTLIKMKPKLSYWITYYNYQFFHTEYAKYLARNQKFEPALQEIDTCLSFNPNYTPALWLKADTLHKLNRVDQALQTYERISEIYGDSNEENYLRNLLKMQLEK